MSSFNPFINPEECAASIGKGSIPEILPFDLKLNDVRDGWKSQPQEFDYELEVEGKLPANLRGTLYRNGPGLMEVYGTPLVHPIDGDGMVCSITINKGKAHFRSKYVRTTEYCIEQKMKKIVFRGMMGTTPSEGWREALHQWATLEGFPNKEFPTPKFKNPSNTNVYYWGGKLLATWESGLPYCLDPQTLQTLGQDTLAGTLSQSKCLAAHFRYDHPSDLLVTFSLRLSLSGPTKLFIYEFDRQWNCLKEQLLRLDQFYYCHDFMLTENYYILHQTPFYAITEENMGQILEGTTSPGESMHFYPNVPSGWYFVPRSPVPPGVEPASRAIFIPCQPFHIYHHLNAVEFVDERTGEWGVEWHSVCFGEEFTMEHEAGVGLSNASVAPGQVWAFRAILGKNSPSPSSSSSSLPVPRLARCELVDKASCEFPSIHPNLNGKPWRYGYLMAADDGFPHIPFQDLVKFDARGEHRQVWSARPERGVLGEAIFVADPQGQREDQGWVLVQEFLAAEHQTHFLVFDAEKVHAGPIARLKLKHHTPYGFHGTFTPEVY